MFCYSKELEIAGVAVDSYKSIMNNHSYKDFIVKNILDTMNIKTVDFLGSYLIYDRDREGELSYFYGDTTDGEFYETVKNKLLQKIKRCRKKYMFFCIGSILYTNDTSHHMIVMLSNENKGCIKIFNSGLYYMEKYQEQIENLIKDIVIKLGHNPVFIDNYMGMSRFGLFLQKSNPQDYCRGGITGIILSYLIYKHSIHNESYCQTWCILMFIYEIEAMKNMKKEGKKYDINKNYMKDLFPQSKYELEILIRKFMLYIATRFENNIDFMGEFKSNISYSNMTYKNEKFSKILETAFKTLHNDIKLK